MRKTSAFLLISTLTTHAMAYSPATHKAMVTSSAEDYNFCLDSLGLKKEKLTPKQVNKIISGNLREDINPTNKLKHWHFYHPEKDLGKGILGWGFASFTKRYDEARLKLKKQNLYKAIGTMSHYVQDVTNPAHVAPIYHGLGDGFDFYDFKSHWPEKISAQKCREIYEKVSKAQTEKETSFALVNDVTKTTLAKMQEKILISTKKYNGYYTWEEAFWSTKAGPTSKQPGFGEYGFLGNAFGKPESGVDQNVTSEFAKERVRAALDASVELFFREL